MGSASDSMTVGGESVCVCVWCVCVCVCVCMCVCVTSCITPSLFLTSRRVCVSRPDEKAQVMW